jgi:transposase
MTYVEASWSQALPDWIGAHTHAFAAFGAVPTLVVSDNLKSGVIRACFYEPEINRSYAEMAAHYGTAILPARPYKPRDKAKVEGAVLLVQRWIIARLRNRQFFSLEELNAAIRDEVARLNARVSRHLGASRQQLFETLDRPAMQPLPPEPFTHADWRHTTVGLDYHVRLEGHHYSVPHDLLRQKLWARLTASTVEIFRAGKRVACHRRAAPGDTGATTLNEHRPASHRRHAETTPDQLRERAARIGPATAILIDVILRDRPHPEQGFRSCLGILRLARSYAPERVEAACDRALAINTRTMASVKSILINRLDGRPPDRPAEATPITHANIRGAKFFH